MCGEEEKNSEPGGKYFHERRIGIVHQAVLYAFHKIKRFFNK